MRDVQIVELVKQGIEILDKIDEMIKTQSVELQKIDYELSDLYHLIENNELSDEASVNVIKRIHDLRKERRALNNEYEIENTYQTHKSKLAGNGTRQFLATEILKTVKQLGKKYTNRVLTEEDIKELIEPVKRKPGRPKKESVKNEK